MELVIYMGGGGRGSIAFWSQETTTAKPEARPGWRGLDL